MGSIPGLTGLFIAGIFSSAMSSVSPILNSMAAITMEDYIKVVLVEFKTKYYVNVRYDEL